MPAIGDLLRDTRVSEDPTRSTDKQRRYQATIPDSWNILYAFGGVTMATAVNAARTALSQPSFDLLSATATFVAPIQAGPATIDVRTLRSGKGSEQMVVDLRSGEGDHSDLHVAVTFGPKRESDTRFADPPVPIVKKPDDTHPPPPPADYPMLKLPYHQSVEIKSCGDRMPWDTSWEGDKARWVHVVEGGDSGWRGGFQYGTGYHTPAVPQGNRGAWNTEKMWHLQHEGQPAWILPPADMCR